MAAVVGMPGFVGRETECDSIAELLVEHDLVTLVGPGGVGKTRLAKEIAGQLSEEFGGGVHFAELSGMVAGDDVGSVVSRQLGVDSIEAMRLRSTGSRTLLILDNCESMLRAAALVVEELTAGTTDIVVLATSRSPLYVHGERVSAVRPFDVPSGDDLTEAASSPAVRLFLERARGAGATWPDNADHLGAVTHLVRLLNGLPLAIELAAARSRMLAPSELADMLDRQLDVLSRPGSNDHRHHSLRSAIHASYEPLSPAQQAFFRQLAIFPAPFDLRLAHAAAGANGAELDTVERLAEMVDASLVESTVTPDGRTSYRLLSSLQAYGQEQLEAVEELRDVQEQYVDAMVATADTIVAAALESFSPEVLGQIREQFVHLAAAISLCLEHDERPDRSYRMFIPFYGPTGANAEVADLARRIRERWTQPAPLRAEAMAIMGGGWVMGGDDSREDVLNEALADPEATELAQMIAHRGLAYMAWKQDDLLTAQHHLDRAIEFAMPFSAAFARELQISRAVVIDDPEDSREAIESLEELSRQAAKHNERVNVVWSAVTIAYHRILLDDIPGARRDAERGAAVAADTGLPWSTSTASRILGTVVALQEGWASAAPHFRSAFDCVTSVGDLDGVAMVLRASAGAALHCGDDERAEQLWRLVPSTVGVPALRSPFAALETELAQRVGPPTPLDLGILVRAARELLDGPTVQLPPVSHLEGADVVAFDDCEFDRSMHELRRDGDRVHIEPQVYDVLAYLIERRGTVVTREEILDEVWGDRFVSLTALSSRIAAARKATGDDGKTQRVIRTVHGKGFAFVAEVF